ncbi:MAG: DUF998 domain-containing protein [Candidatus Geothermarchaeales archaeon]
MPESGAQTDSNQRVLATAGIIGPVLFTVVVVILGFLRPGYSHITQFMSELGAVGAPNAIIMDINFIVSGLLSVAFAFGLHRGIGGGDLRVGPALLALFGAGWAGAGIFPVDLAEPESFTANMHGLVVFPALLAAILAPILISRRLREDSLWQGYSTYSLATGFLALAVFPLLGLRFLDFGFEAPVGAVQRIFFGVWFLWIEVMAIRLLLVSTKTDV